MVTQDLIRPSVIDHPHSYTLPVGLRETPVDEITGLPWCFAPNPDLPPIPNGPNYERRGEWNHQYPKAEVLYGDNPILSDLGSLALLNIRQQWVTYEDHHYRYNPNYIGPRQPASHQQLTKTLVMGLAGDVPEFALDFSCGKQRDRRLSQQEREFLWRSGQLRVSSEPVVGLYLREVVLSQEVDHIRMGELDEFLNTYDHNRRLYLGHCIAAKMVERAVEPIEGVYSSALKAGRLPQTLPGNSRDFVKEHLTSGRRFGFIFSELHRILGARKRTLLASGIA